MLDRREITHRFTYHAATTKKTEQAHSTIRAACEALAHVVNECCVDGREKSTAITKIEEAMFWANGSIARGPTHSPPKSEDD